MKKGLVYLFVLLMSTSVFTACSDDDDDVSPVVGTWQLSKVDDAPEMMVNITSANDSVRLAYTPDDVNMISNKEFAGFFKMMILSYGGEYLNALNWIEFQENGDIRISITQEGTEQIIPTGIVRHYIKGDKIYIGVKKELLASLGDIDLSKIPGLKEMGDGDIAMPLMYRINADKGEFYVTKEMMLPFFDIVKTFMPAELVFIIDAFKGAIESAKTFEMGLVLQKQVATPKK